MERSFVKGEGKGGKREWLGGKGGSGIRGKGYEGRKKRDKEVWERSIGEEKERQKNRYGRREEGGWRIGKEKDMD